MTIYHDQVLLGPLKMFYDESMSEIPEPIVMEDGAPVHKGASNNPQEDLK